MAAMVTTVTGPIPSTDLGITLTHEHVFNDVTSWHQPTSSNGWDPQVFAGHPVDETILWDLRQDPFGNRANCRLDDPIVATAEVHQFANMGGTTILDATGLGMGRDLQALKRVSLATGVQIVAGTGYYLDASQPEGVRQSTVEELTRAILADVHEGEHGIRPGMIGEIGVGEDFTPAEQRSLRAAARAQVETSLPLQVHLPGWFRRGHDVLDVVEAEGVDPRWVVLCHMGPSGADLDYQEGLVDRGAWIQYDMIGMEVFYGDQQVQCPSDDDNARWLARLVERGHLGRLLISHDVFLKSLLRCHGGPGYAHILQYFVPRLRRHGLADEDITGLLVDNPRRLFADDDDAADDDAATRPAERIPRDRQETP